MLLENFQEPKKKFTKTSQENCKMTHPKQKCQSAEYNFTNVKRALVIVIYNSN